MLGRVGVSEPFGVGLVDAAFASPDPDDLDAFFEQARNARRRSTVSVAELRAYDILKRGFDLAVSLALLVILSPVMLVVLALVKLTSRGPAVFCQNRLTVGGKVFKMYKFRSMRVDAEVGTGAVWAQKHDPRVTRVGRFLRSSRLDELPQLLNVLQGDMSLIGPRPERPELAQQLANELPGFYQRLAVKGGITGLAQISSGYAANADTYREKLTHDLLYIRNRSFRLDLMIAVRTVLVVFTGYGAR